MHRARTMLLAALAALAPGAIRLEAQEDAKPPSAEELFERGSKALFQGRYEEATKLLQSALEARGDKAPASYRLQLARAHRYAGRPAEGAKLLVAILAASPDHVEAGQLLAEIYREQKRWKDILAVLEPLLRYRHDYLSHHLLAEAAYNLEDLTKARSYYREALRLNPNSAPDHYQLGNIYLAGNRFALAAGSYENALRLGLESAVLHYKLASAYFNLRIDFGAVKELAIPAGRVGEIHGEWFLIEAIPGQADHFLAAPRHSAIYQCAAALRAGMEASADLRMLMAGIYLHARRHAKAHELYLSLAEEVPAGERALYYYYRAQSALGLGRYEEYLNTLEKAVALDASAYGPALLEALREVARRHEQAGDLPHYIEYLRRAVQLSPETASVHLELGNALEEAGQHGAAIVQWRMVLDLEPDHAERNRLLDLISR